MVKDADGDGLAVDVAAEVKDVDFYAALCAVGKGGAVAYVEHAEVRAAFCLSADEIDAVLRDELEGRYLYVGCGKTESCAYMMAMHHYASHGVGAAEDGVGCGEIAISEGLASRGRGYLVMGIGVLIGVDDLYAQCFAVFRYVLVSLAVMAEMIVITDDEDSHLQLVMEHCLHEVEG